ncbi:MAG: hypothetical protein MMC23_008932 [Stictis urceolatum]|nr:hypothetical protein [Stictis urceolata]
MGNMQAIRIQSNQADEPTPFSPADPAPSSALGLNYDIPIPRPNKSGEMLVRIRAASIIRDTLTWPEMYHHPYAIPGNDFAGTIVSVYENRGYDTNIPNSFSPGDEVYGMSHANRPCTWAEYAVVKVDEAAPKPKTLSFSLQLYR